MVLKYSTSAELDRVEDEFLENQLLQEATIPKTVWQAALVADGETHHHRMDVIWSHLMKMMDPSRCPMFENLARIVLLVLTLPHPNAEEECVFSLVTKNKTKFRPNLKLDGTLSSILTIKLGKTQPCQSYKPPKAVLESAKKAKSGS